MIAFSIGINFSKSQEERESNIKEQVDYLHSVAAVLVILLTILLIISGIILRIQRKRFWKLNWLNLNARFHKIFGYLIIFIAFIALQTGEYMKQTLSKNGNPQYKYFYMYFMKK